MALKKRYAKQDDIPEALRSLYKQAGSEFVLDLDGGDDDDGDSASGDVAKKLAEFRESNRKLMASQKAKDDELAALKKRVGEFGDADPAQVQAVLAALQGSDEAAMIKAGRLDDVVSKRMKGREAEWQKRMEEATKAASEREAEGAKLRAVLAQKVLREKMIDAAAAKKVRLRQSAIEDFIGRAERDWKVSDPIAGDLAPARDGAPWDKPEAYIDDIVRQAPHLFEESGGGGAGGGGGRTGQGGVKVYRRSELTDKQYAAVLVDVAAGKAAVEMGK
jgi:hypothetical protein